MKMFDNLAGFGFHLDTGTVNEYNDNNLMEFNDNILIGETPIPDCPNAKNGDYCIRSDKYAMLPGIAARGGKNLMMTAPSAFPMYNIHGLSSWSGVTVINRNKFINFKHKTEYGKLNSVFGSSEYAPDYIPEMRSFDTIF